MRKHYKNKSGPSCAMCKPWKKKHDKRWKPRELVRLQEFEQDRQLALRREL